MADNYNINPTQGESLEAGGLDQANPAMTYVDFATQISNNATNQQRQAEMVKQAIEQTKQQQLKTRQGLGAESLGINPETKDFLTVEEAVAELKAAGIDDDQIKAFVTALGGQQAVSRQSVDAVIRKKEAQAKAGQPFIASDADAKNPSMVTKEGDQLVSGQSYYDTGEKDADGNAIYGHGGKEPTEKPAMSAAQTAQKWAQLGKALHDDVKVGRGTALTQSLMRANRALNYLATHPNLDRPGLMYIQQDMVGIFQGGVPTEEEMKNADYSTGVQKLNQLIGSFTGNFGALKWNSVTAGDKSYVRTQLQELILDMRKGLIDTIESMIAADSTGYEDIINADPQRYHRMLDAYTKTVDSGLNKEAHALANPEQAVATTPAPATAAPATPAATGGPDINALASALGLKKKAPVAQ